MVLTLTRWAQTGHGTLGRLGPWYTMENPWKDNARGKSCIPAGTYKCRRAFFNRGGYPTFEVLDVPGRSHILFHIGNTSADTEGCILPGKTLGVLSTWLAVLQSGPAFREFMRSLEGVDEFTLVIKEAD
jgi:hypothetical protein